MEAEIVQLNVGKPKNYSWKGKAERSAIGKASVEEVLLTRKGFVGDGVEDHQNHGGPDRAVCLYPFEHYLQWENEFNTKFEIPAFGENLTVTGMLEKDVFIGDIYKLGRAIVEVSLGRVPCSTISKHNGVDRLLNRVFDTGYTGYFFRVIEEGRVLEDSEITLLDRVQENISVLRSNQIILQERDNRNAAQQLILIDALAEEWKEKLRKRIV
jgi:MOSC domain-containing protein YiiM